MYRLLFSLLVVFTPLVSNAYNLSQDEAQRVYSTYSSESLPTNQTDVKIWNALHAYQELLLTRGIVDAGREEFMTGFVEEVNKGTLDNIFNANQSVRSGDVRMTITSGTLTDDVTDPTNSNFQIVPANCYGTKGTNLSKDAKDRGDCGWRDIIALINRIMKFLVYISASLSALAFAYAGFLYMTAFGNSGKIEQAHGIFSKTLIGIMFVLLGWLLVATLLRVLGVNESFSLLNMNGVTGL